MPTSEPVVREPAHRRLVANEGPAAMLRPYQALAAKQTYSVPDRSARDAVLDEPIEAGLIREVEEETGLQVEPTALTGVYKNVRRGIVALVFRCRVLGETARPTPETLDMQWLTREQLDDRMAEAYRVRLTDAVDSDQPSVRTHDGVRILVDLPALRPERRTGAQAMPLMDSLASPPR